MLRRLYTLARFMRFLRNGYAVYRNVYRKGEEIRSLDFWDGTRFQIRDSGAASHIFLEIFVDGCYDFPEVKTAHQIVDVGANIGLFSYFARRKNPNANILAIEADPHTAKVLQANLGNRGVEVLHCAASDQSGTISFYSSNVSGWSSLYDVRGAVGGEQVTVPATKLSSLLKDRGIDRVGLLKIDVEGAEYPILLGDRDLWEIKIDAILVEVDRNPRDTRYSYEQIDGLLRRSFRHVSIVNSDPEYPLIYATNA